MVGRAALHRGIVRTSAWLLAGSELWSSAGLSSFELAVVVTG